MQRTCCGNDHCGCQRCGRVLQVGSKPAPPFRHTGRDATIWWHGKLTPILHDMPVERCCSTSSGAASTTATHTACDHHCCGSAPSPAAAAIRKFRPGTTTRGHHSRAASISPLREENDLHGSICEIIGPRAVCDRTSTRQDPMRIGANAERPEVGILHASGLHSKCDYIAIATDGHAGA